MVVQIQSEDDPPHLISLIKGGCGTVQSDSGLIFSAVSASDGDPSGWHVFNDFLVRPISEEEALGFPGTWKASLYKHILRVSRPGF